MSKYVAVKTLDEIEIHLPHTTGNWYSLCGLAGADEDSAVQQGIVDVPKGVRVDCRARKAIWELAQGFTSRDFEG